MADTPTLAFLESPSLEHRERAVDPDSDLIVTVKGASNLPPSASGLVDSYVSISVLRDGVKERRWRSSVAQQTLSPEWQLHNVFAAKPFTPHHQLRVTVRSFGPSAALLGSALLNYDDLLARRGQSDTPVELQPSGVQLRLHVAFPQLQLWRQASLRESEGPYEALGHTDDDPVFFVFNGKEFDGASTPSALRTCRSPFRPELVAECQQMGLPLPSRVGLDTLRISGSAQFGRRGLRSIIDLAIEHGAQPNFIVVCDLRGEPHMLLNGFPVSWYNRGDKLGANLPPVECDELTRTYVRSLLKRRTVDVRRVLEKGEQGLPARTESVRVPIEQIETEEMLVHREFHLGYNRIPINDHESPEVRDADQLVSFYQSSPRGTWWHFHCAGGKGRTTTAMVLIDMLLNRHENQELTVRDFVLRQWLIGGINLDVSAEPSQPGSAWKHRDAQIRKQFLDIFFRYTRDKDAHAQGLMFFSTWLRQNEIVWPPDDSTLPSDD